MQSWGCNMKDIMIKNYMIRFHKTFRKVFHYGKYMIGHFNQGLYLLQKENNMNKFWKWMEEKGYTADAFVGGLRGICRNGVDPTHQMLIGYMMEYLDDNTNSTWYNDVTRWKRYGGCDAFTDFRATYIPEERYNWLVSKINELDEDK